MEKVLAKRSELNDPCWVKVMDQLNPTARRGGLYEYKTYCRIWEYPWLWFQIQGLPRENTRILDMGSECSPFPWYLATKGFDVIVSDVETNHWDLWKTASRNLGVNPQLKILDSQDLALPTESVDVYESISILEHVPNKAQVIEEAARVLRRGGLLLMTFDICEPDMGMTFPDWNGRAVSMLEIDRLFAESPWFEPGLPDLTWNIDSIPDYLAWHRTTAPHHNYVTGAIAIRRNQDPWLGKRRKIWFTRARGAYQTFSPAFRWRIRELSRRIKQYLPRPVHSALKKGKSWLTQAR